MPARLVRCRHNGVEFNAGPAHAKTQGYEVLDESAYDRGGNPKPTTRLGGRPRKPKVSVAELVTEKAAESADSKSDNAPSKE